jgi:hypothetical protein
MRWCRYKCDLQVISKRLESEPTVPSYFTLATVSNGVSAHDRQSRTLYFPGLCFLKGQANLDPSSASCGMYESVLGCFGFLPSLFSSSWSFSLPLFLLNAEVEVDVSVGAGNSVVIEYCVLWLPCPSSKSTGS